jgi:hypothetical protein
MSIREMPCFDAFLGTARQAQIGAKPALSSPPAITCPEAPAPANLNSLDAEGPDNTKSVNYQ